jgi:hypothetical protein
VIGSGASPNPRGLSFCRRNETPAHDLNGCGANLLFRASRASGGKTLADRTPLGSFFANVENSVFLDSRAPSAVA